jgi:phage-related minor tail protein
MPTVSSAAWPISGSNHTGAAVTSAAAVTAAAVTGTTPAGGTGATAGAYDTAQHRDDLIATVAELKVAVNALRTDLISLRTSHEALLTSLETATIIDT